MGASRMFRQDFNLILFLIISLNGWKLAAASNYDAYLAKMMAESQLAKEEFLRNNPRGQIVLDRLSSSEYRKNHPILGGEYDDKPDVDEDEWLTFLKELNDAREEAASKYDGQTKREADWYEREQPEFVISSQNITEPQEVAPRRTEVAYQNPLWGVHKVTGGSSEVGQWLDYALLGAGAQDAEEDNELSTLVLNDLDGADHLKESLLKNDSLPAYCDPPNPCPVGYDQDKLPTPCDSQTVYTMEVNREWILTKVANGECSCDTEHMNTCHLDTLIVGDNEESVDEIQNARTKSSGENPYLVGQKRSRLVAKKARWTQSPLENPYLAGQKKKRMVVKKMYRPHLPQRYYYMQGKVLKKVVKKNGHFSNPAE